MPAKEPSYIVRFLAYLGVLALIFVVGMLLSRLTLVIAYFLIAAAICYLINPFADMLERRRVPRGLSILLLFTIFAAGVTIGLMLLIPPIRDEIKSLSDNFPKYSKVATEYWDTINERYGWVRNHQEWEGVIQKASQTAQKFGLKIAGRMVGGIMSIFSILPGLVVIPVLVYYFLKDGHKMKGAFLRSLPSPWRPDAEQMIFRTNDAIGGYIQGQLKLCLAMGVLTWAAMQFVCRLDYAIIMGLIAGITEFIPYLGPILAAIMPLTVAAFDGPDKVVLVLGVSVAIQLLEGNVMAPRIMSGDVGMHPALIIFVLMAGGSIGGVPGMIVALPAAVILKVFYEYFYLEKFVKKYEPEPEAAAPQAAEPTPPAENSPA